MNKFCAGLLALIPAIVSLTLTTEPASARPRVTDNLGPDEWVTCNAIIPGSGTPGRHYYAWWNPGWPAGHNTVQSAIDICNQWHGGASGYPIQPIANTPHTGPHQYIPPRIYSVAKPVVIMNKGALGPNDPTPPPPCGPYTGPANQNPC
jgi:hypothetical protein